MPKIFVGQSFSVAIISGIEKVWIRRGGHQDFPSKIFCLTVPKKFRRAILHCCNKFGYRKNLDERGGVSRISVEKFLSHSAEKIRRAILHCCNNFGYRKSLDKRGGIKIFRRKLFCLTVPKSSVGESFTVAIISGIEKFWIRGGGEYQDFPWKNFLSQSAKRFRRGILYCCINFGHRKIFCFGGLCHEFLTTSLSHSAEKFRR